MHSDSKESIDHYDTRLSQNTIENLDKGNYDPKRDQKSQEQNKETQLNSKVSVHRSLNKMSTEVIKSKTPIKSRKSNQVDTKSATTNIENVMNRLSNGNEALSSLNLVKMNSTHDIRRGISQL